MSGRNGLVLSDSPGFTEQIITGLFSHYNQARTAASPEEMLSVIAEAQLVQVQLQMLLMADIRDVLRLSGWPGTPTKPVQVSVGTTAVLVLDLEGGERTVVDLYVHDPTGASPVAFGGPGVTFTNGHIVPAGVIVPAWPLTESLYAVAQTGTVTVSLRRRG